MSHSGSLPHQTLGAVGQRIAPQVGNDGEPFTAPRERLLMGSEAALFYAYRNTKHVCPCGHSEDRMPWDGRSRLEQRQRELAQRTIAAEAEERTA